MTPEQYERWKDFALRMARHAFPDATPARRAKIEEEINQFFWSSYDDEPKRIAEIIDWDNCPPYEWHGRTYYNPCVGDEVSSFLSDHYHERLGRRGRYEPRGNKFESQVSCCIRAGLDCASSPSAGVLGFTVGDLRRMYPEKIPDWVVKDFQPPITPEVPDNAGVWL
jgi:hypothetical protein